jgi:hypothetical protein
MQKIRYRDSMARIARAMLKQRHGGTLLILPEGLAWEARVSSRRYSPNNPVDIVKRADARTRDYWAWRDKQRQARTQEELNITDSSMLSEDLERFSFPYTLDWLAHLTATDGMTVIRTDFTILDFGVFFNTQENDGDRTRVFVIDPYRDGSEAIGLESIGGARHQSAAVTCRHLQGAHAIVASQDGNLSSMKWNPQENAVEVNRHLELLLDV